MNKFKCLVIASAAIGAWCTVPAASASTISYTDITAGSSVANLGGVVVKALKNGYTSTFGIKCNGANDANHCGFGVDGGPAQQEIDALDNDSLLFDYSALGGVYIDSFKLTLLYNGPEFGDISEIARVRINGLSDFTFTVLGENTGSWNSAGSSVSSCSPTTQDEGGCFNVANPFAGTLINSLQFYAYNNGNNNNSDYTVSSVTTTSVPEPATLSLFGLGLAAMGFASRRRAKI